MNDQPAYSEHQSIDSTHHRASAAGLYDDPGADYYTRLRPDRTKKRAIHQLENMGYTVTLERAG